MSQRDSGYARHDRDLYETPEWATMAVVPYLLWPRLTLEPACGSGKMVNALRSAGLSVVCSDIDSGQDFLELKATDASAIVTNPPYDKARDFIEHAIKLMVPNRGLVAMLLRTDFDHAKTRRHLFSGSPYFARKVVLTKRIVWFEKKGAAPSFNHAWYIWDIRNVSSPVISYDIQEG